MRVRSTPLTSTTIWHEAIDRLWPVALLAMCIVTPWLVVKSYRELKNGR